jgi:hypothetical protein
MAQTVTAFPNGGRRSNKYPYDEWLDGQIWLLVRGEDYDISPEGMRASIHNHAKREGIKVKTRISDEGLFVQLVEPDEDDEN